MYIHEAISEAMVRKYNIGRASNSGFSIEPTDGPMCCIMHFEDAGEDSAPQWSPQASALLANDWVLVPRSLDRQKRKSPNRCP